MRTGVNLTGFRCVNKIRDDVGTTAYVKFKKVEFFQVFTFTKPFIHRL